MNIVVLSPHRDDAAFSLGLAIGSWLEQGLRVSVLNCFTRSEYAPYAETEFVHANDRLSYITAVRKREDEEWTKLYRPSLPLHDLRLKDAPLRLRVDTDTVCGLPVRDGDKATLKIGKAVGGTGTEAWVLPLALGNHVDHVTARDAALSALKAAPGDSPAQAFAYYEDLPYAARPGAAGEIEQRVQELAARCGEELLPVFVAEPADESAAERRKLRMAECYDSQIDSVVAGDIAAFSHRYGGRERLWANAAWHRAFAGTSAA